MNVKEYRLPFPLYQNAMYFKFYLKLILVMRFVNHVYKVVQIASHYRLFPTLINGL